MWLRQVMQKTVSCPALHFFQPAEDRRRCETQFSNESAAMFENAFRQGKSRRVLIVRYGDEHRMVAYLKHPMPPDRLEVGIIPA